MRCNETGVERGGTLETGVKIGDMLETRVELEEVW